MSSEAPAAVAPPRRLRAALVLRPHGLRGEVRAEVLGGDTERFRRGTRVFVEGSDRQLTVLASRRGPDGTALLRLRGVDTPEQAATLRGAYLCVDVAEARRLAADEWFVWQLVGMRCVSVEGELLGTVADIEPAPAADVLVIEDPCGTRRYPMVREFVRGVDVAAGVLTLAPLAEDAR